MLRSICLTNWKSFGPKPTAIPLARLTFLLGPNGSGKSNVLDALRLLQGVAFDYSLGEALRGAHDGGVRSWDGVRGGESEAMRLGARTMRVGVVFAASEQAPHEFCIALDSDTVEYSLSGAQEYVWMGDATKLRSSVSVGGFVDYLQQLRGQQPEPPGAAQAVKALEWFREHMRSARFIEFQPERMRDYKPEKANTLGSAGDNISPVLAACEAETLEEIVDWVSELCGPTVRGIAFDRTQLGEVMFFLNEAGNKVSARSVSDGTLRFLGLVTALLTLPPRSLLLLEEPEVGLHPARMALLVSLLQNIGTARELQIIATTHSPQLLSYLSSEALADAVALRRDLTTGQSSAVQLGLLPHFSMLRDSTQLADLVSSGWIEQAQ